MQQLVNGIWHWTADHPAWKDGEEWGRTVSSYAIDDGAGLLLFDPLAVPAEIEALVPEREAAIVLTCPWHHRDAEVWGPANGVPIFLPPLDEGDPNEPAGETFEAGDELAVGVVAYPGVERNDLVLWVPSVNAIVIGDTIIDQGDGLEIWIQSWNTETSVDDVRQRLLPLLDLPIEHVLATHGGPFGRDELERVLASTA